MGLFSGFTKKDDKKDEKKVPADSPSRPVDPMNELAAPIKGVTRSSGSQTAIPRSPNTPSGEEAAPTQNRRGFVPSREDAAAYNARRRSAKAQQLSRVLENTGLMTEEQIEQLIRSHGESATTLKRAVENQGLMKELDFTKALAESLRMDHVSLSEVDVTPELIARVPKKLAKEYRVFPVAWDEAKRELKLAISDPLNIGAIDDLQRILGVKTVSLVASEDEIDRYYKKWYEVDQIQAVYEQATEEAHRKDQATMDQYTTVDLVGDDANQPAVVKFVDLIFRQAVHDRASDIHIEPSRNAVAIRFRVDGVLHELPAPPKKWQNAIISRIKVLSGMDLAEKRIPQDGRIKLNLPDRKLDLRVSSLPAIYGESVVMRILDQSNVMLGLEDVGFLPENVSLFRTLISSPNGVILMTGPTGSGKTTTLYSALGVLNNPETKIITVENPVEYMIDGINQVQVSEELGLTFSKALRSMLRQSPDVILVGEIRDMETAEIAVRAALTGHLVFSTLHTNDAPSAPTRLVDMGIKPFLVASAVQAAIAQRLIRKLCMHCKSPIQPTPELVQEAGGSPDDVANCHALGFYGPTGCERCEGKGYRGRTAIHEIFVLDSRMRNYIIRGESATRLKKIAVKNGMRSLRMDGYEKAKMGITSLEEVMRMTQGD